MSFKKGDRVELLTRDGDRTGSLGTILLPREERGSLYNRIKFDDGHEDGWSDNRLRIVPEPVTLKLAHKTNGSALQIVVSDGSENADKINGVIEGTTEPVVTFVSSDWKSEVVAPPFVFPTKRGAIISSKGGSLYVRVSNSPRSHWRALSGSGSYPTAAFGSAHDYTVIFEGTD